jgi:hypothetical protein
MSRLDCRTKPYSRPWTGDLKMVLALTEPGPNDTPAIPDEIGPKGAGG